MLNKRFVLLATVAASVFLTCRNTFAQTPLTDTNIQLFYDFGGDRKFVTTTLEMFHPDGWGSTFFFVDIDYNFKTGNGKNVGPGGAYMEIERSLNFWKNSAVKDLSLQVEYDGGLGALGGGYTINHAFLAGPNYSIHSSDFRNTLNLSLLFKKFIGLEQDVPMQFTAVWGLQDLFGAKGLVFSGFADVWCERSDIVFLSEPQLWYAVGQFFSCPNLNLGTEIEISNNFAGVQGWKCCPCLGLKWIF
ncbi:MAG: DUF5020 family protein [Bacteroidaceae bacterium]|nr:DUF5020 family protein [Bacteroidaceae bacterium]